jgi:methylglyoxal synthase
MEPRSWCHSSEQRRWGRVPDCETMEVNRGDGAYRPRLAIIAHDGKKADLVAFATFNRQRLQRCQLMATGTTGTLLVEKVGLSVERVESGPIGGDVQIASRIVDGQVDAVVFVVDPLDKHPHDPDIQTLLRICNVRNVPLATNIATADMLISSGLFWRVDASGRGEKAG